VSDDEKGFSDSEFDEFEFSPSPGEIARDRELREQGGVNFGARLGKRMKQEDAWATAPPLPPRAGDRFRAGRSRPRFDGKTMPWGKHAGAPLTQVPVTYIAWIFSEQAAGEMSIPDPLAEALLNAFMVQLMKLPVYRRVIESLAAQERPRVSDARPVVLPGGPDTDPL
jgi:hypothetical protein